MEAKRKAASKPHADVSQAKIHTLDTSMQRKPLKKGRF